MQFVAVPSGAGYSVEAQIAKVEAVGGIQLMVTPIKRGAIANLKVDRLGQSQLSIRTQLNATVHELMTKISAKLSTPIEQFKLLFNGRTLDKGASMNFSILLLLLTRTDRLLSYYDIQAVSF